MFLACTATSLHLEALTMLHFICCSSFDAHASHLSLLLALGPCRRRRAMAARAVFERLRSGIWCKLFVFAKARCRRAAEEEPSAAMGQNWHAAGQ